MVYGRLEAAAGYLVAITFVDDLWMIEGHLVTITAPTSGDAEGIVAAELTRVARREV